MKHEEGGGLLLLEEGPNYGLEVNVSSRKNTKCRRKVNDPKATRNYSFSFHDVGTGTSTQ